MINVRSKDEIDLIRECGLINSEVHAKVAELLKPGISTGELDEVAQHVMNRRGAKSSIIDAFRFPGHICISINKEVGHGVPGTYKIGYGDIVKIDVSVEHQGYHTDCAVTHIVGSATGNVTHLVESTQQALAAGIRSAVPGNRFSDISFAVKEVVRNEGLNVVRRAFGHGIGTELHEAPPIPSFGPPHLGPLIRPGMVIAIEPVVSLGSGLTYKSDNGWTDVAADNAMSAHIERTVVITEHGSEIVTPYLEAAGMPNQSRDRRSRIIYRRMRHEEEQVLFKLAAKEMDPILIEAWGRRTNPKEIFGQRDAEVIVLEDEKHQVAGFMVLVPESKALHLSTIVLSDCHQGKGIGKMAMRHVEQHARVDRLNRVTLCVQTNNERAIQFYLRLGYRNLGYVNANTLLMEKRLIEEEK